MRKWIGLILIVVFMCADISKAAAAPYEGYNYTYWRDAVSSPVAYLPGSVIDGRKLGIGNFKEPEDLYVTDDRIYLLDSGNGRIVIIDHDWNVIKTIDSYTNEGQTHHFSHPEGIFVTEEREIYIADTKNSKIVVLAEDGTYLSEIGADATRGIREGFQFFPRKVAVDKAKRVYVVGRGVFDGLIEFDTDGNFSGFMGTNRVTFKFADYIWKTISTREQREKMTLFVPTEFVNVDLDEEGFIYAVTVDKNSTQPIKRLNPGGIDVLRRERLDQTPRGDIEIAQVGLKTGPSTFTDIKVGAGGIYSALDTNRGRIFTYNEDGILLYIFGQQGGLEGTFKSPVALEKLGNEMLVLDKAENRIVVFEPTEFGKLVYDAATLHASGDANGAAEIWKQVLQLNSNYEIAYTGIGKALLRQDKNKEAMSYFKLGHSREYYSKAFQRYRKDVLRDHFTTIVLSLVALAGVVLFVLRRFRRETVSIDDAGTLAFPFRLITRPFAGYWNLKYEGKGRTWIALLILILLTITVIMQRKYTGFIMNFSNPDKLNSIDELLFIVLPFVLWCVSNWSLTTLMDGEGKFKEIVQATAYALLPMIIIYAPMTAISHFFTWEESAFYFFMTSFATAWFLFLLFVGTMVVHQYTVKKTIVTIGLTILVMGFIVFLGLLFFSLMQQIIAFVLTLYNEIIFRV